MRCGRAWRGYAGLSRLALTWLICTTAMTFRDGSAASAEPNPEPADTTAVYDLDTLTVFGRRLRNPMVDPTVEVPSLELSTATVDRKDFARQGAVTVTDALAYTPGARVESRGRKVKQFFSIRGQTYPYPDYAMDGTWQREFHELPYFLPTAEIERVEIVRSTAALLKSPTDRRFSTVVGYPDAGRRVSVGIRQTLR